ncbi:MULTISPECIES: DUF4304 domain-containing protein [Rhizobium]|uniref:DUF4304 domain-containing protein n=1 Tax=Rhizobium paranaense TaxID=1650438 RepID=A0A7W8XW28_9HYPH|nr:MULTISPECIES: DUF4304 domain-containing protein [Rhizobium]MBB5576414.1 hypothetical protein [Rhizobium paranaense]PST62547.1 hypothetical protein C9E91_13475 [Rhizobium sp. SEMIA4064]
MGGAAKSIDEVIKRGFAQLLKSEGFKKSGRNWHRSQGKDWLIVNLQASRWNLEENGKFTVNLGVFVAAVASMAGQNAIEGKPSEPSATLRTRLGTLVYGRDHWWEVTAASDLDLVAADLAEKMQSTGIPWLESHLDPSRLAAALKDSPSLLSFSAALLSGDRDEATRRLREAIGLRPAARTYFLAWASNNGISL